MVLYIHLREEVRRVNRKHTISEKVKTMKPRKVIIQIEAETNRKIAQIRNSMLSYAKYTFGGKPEVRVNVIRETK